MLSGFVLHAVESPVSEGELGRVSSYRRGKSDQNSNNCKKIVQSVAHLRQRLPSYDGVQEARAAVNTRQNAAVGIELCNRLEAGLKAIDVLEQFNLAHCSVSKPPC